MQGHALDEFQEVPQCHRQSKSSVCLFQAQCMTSEQLGFKTESTILAVPCLTQQNVRQIIGRQANQHFNLIDSLRKSSVESAV